MSPEKMLDRKFGLDRLHDEALATTMLHRDPFDVVTYAKVHIANHDRDGSIDQHDYSALDLLAEKQEELL